MADVDSRRTLQMPPTQSELLPKRSTGTSGHAVPAPASSAVAAPAAADSEAKRFAVPRAQKGSSPAASSATPLEDVSCVRPQPLSALQATPAPSPAAVASRRLSTMPGGSSPQRRAAELALKQPRPASPASASSAVSDEDATASSVRTAADDGADSSSATSSRSASPHPLQRSAVFVAEVPTDAAAAASTALQIDQFVRSVVDAATATCDAIQSDTAILAAAGLPSEEDEDYSLLPSSGADDDDDNEDEESERERYDTFLRWMADHGAYFPHLALRRYAKNYRGVHVRASDEPALQGQGQTAEAERDASLRQAATVQPSSPSASAEEEKMCRELATASPTVASASTPEPESPSASESSSGSGSAPPPCASPTPPRSPVAATTAPAADSAPSSRPPLYLAKGSLLLSIPHPLLVTVELARASVLGKIVSPLPSLGSQAILAMYLLQEKHRQHVHERACKEREQQQQQQQAQQRSERKRHEEQVPLPAKQLLVEEEKSPAPAPTAVAPLSSESDTSVVAPLLPAASFWAPWLAVMPSSFGSLPLFYSAEESAALEGCTELMAKVAAQRRSMREEYLAIKAALKAEHCKMVRAGLAEDIGADASSAPLPFFLEFLRGFRFRSFVWACLAVGTRVFSLQIHASKTSVLAPLADMMNHHTVYNDHDASVPLGSGGNASGGGVYRTGAGTNWTFDPRRDAFTLTSCARLRQGDAVYESYGVKSNVRFLASYGFCLEHNQANEVAITIQTEEEEEEQEQEDDEEEEGAPGQADGVPAPQPSPAPSHQPRPPLRSFTLHGCWDPLAEDLLNFLRIANVYESQLAQEQEQAEADAAAQAQAEAEAEAEAEAQAAAHAHAQMLADAEAEGDAALHSMRPRPSPATDGAYFTAPPMRPPRSPYYPVSSVYRPRPASSSFYPGVGLAGAASLSASGPISLDNELASLYTLRQSCRRALRNYPTSLVHDAGLLSALPQDGSDGIAGFNQRNILLFRMGEKKILHYFVDLATLAIALLCAPWDERELQIMGHPPQPAQERSRGFSYDGAEEGDDASFRARQPSLPANASCKAKVQFLLRTGSVEGILAPYCDRDRERQRQRRKTDEDPKRSSSSSKVEPTEQKEEKTLSVAVEDEATHQGEEEEIDEFTPALSCPPSLSLLLHDLSCTHGALRHAASCGGGAPSEAAALALSTAPPPGQGVLAYIQAVVVPLQQARFRALLQRHRRIQKKQALLAALHMHREREREEGGRGQRKQRQQHADWETSFPNPPRERKQPHHPSSSAHVHMSKWQQLAHLQRPESGEVEEPFDEEEDEDGLALARFRSYGGGDDGEIDVDDDDDAAFADEAYSHSDLLDRRYGQEAYGAPSGLPHRARVLTGGEGEHDEDLSPLDSDDEQDDVDDEPEHDFAAHQHHQHHLHLQQRMPYSEADLLAYYRRRLLRADGAHGDEEDDAAFDSDDGAFDLDLEQDDFDDDGEEVEDEGEEEGEWSAAPSALSSRRGERIHRLDHRAEFEGEDEEEDGGADAEDDKGASRPQTDRARLHSASRSRRSQTDSASASRARSRVGFARPISAAFHIASLRAASDSASLRPRSSSALSRSVSVSRPGTTGTGSSRATSRSVSRAAFLDSCYEQAQAAQKQRRLCSREGVVRDGVVAAAAEEEEAELERAEDSIMHNEAAGDEDSNPLDSHRSDDEEQEHEESDVGQTVPAAVTAPAASVPPASSAAGRSGTVSGGVRIKIVSAKARVNAPTVKASLVVVAASKSATAAVRVAAGAQPKKSVAATVASNATVSRPAPRTVFHDASSGASAGAANTAATRGTGKTSTVRVTQTAVVLQPRVASVSLASKPAGSAVPAASSSASTVPPARKKVLSVSTPRHVSAAATSKPAARTTVSVAVGPSPSPSPTPSTPLAARSGPSSRFAVPSSPPSARSGGAGAAHRTFNAASASPAVAVAASPSSSISLGATAPLSPLVLSPSHPAAPSTPSKLPGARSCTVNLRSSPSSSTPSSSPTRMLPAVCTPQGRAVASPSGAGSGSTARPLRVASASASPQARLPQVISPALASQARFERSASHASASSSTVVSPLAMSLPALPSSGARVNSGGQGSASRSAASSSHTTPQSSPSHARTTVKIRVGSASPAAASPSAASASAAGVALTPRRRGFSLSPQQPHQLHSSHPVSTPPHARRTGGATAVAAAALVRASPVTVAAGSGAGHPVSPLHVPATLPASFHFTGSAGSPLHRSGSPLHRSGASAVASASGATIHVRQHKHSAGAVAEGKSASVAHSTTAM